MIWGTDVQWLTENIVKADSEIRIDREDNEPAWANSEIYSDFTKYEPANGQPLSDLFCLCISSDGSIDTLVFSQDRTH